MVEMLKTALGTLLLLFQSHSRLQVEILALRQQLVVLRRTAPKRVRLRTLDRLLFVLLYRLWPGVLDSIAVIQPDTIVRWHRRGFRALWWWKYRRRLGRPGIAKDVRDLIREISRANPLWGAPRVHGELLKLGIDVPDRQWRSTCRGSGDRRRNPGGPSCTITPKRSPPSISSSFRRSH
jgi:hypothetical protein